MSEGAAYGAAIQAFWCYEKSVGRAVSIDKLSDHFITLNEDEITRPQAENVARYQKLQALQNELSQSLRPAFELHSKLDAPQREQI